MADSMRDTARFERVFQNVNGYIENGDIDGAALAVAVRGEQIVDWSAGNARAEMPASSSTLWPLASISKVYTAAMIMVLVERGVLSLSTTASSLLPGFTGDGRDDITLRHLMTHSSGLIYESPDMENVLLRQTPYDEIVDEAYRHPLLFTPGTSLSYADYNFAIAGRMASIATCTPFADLVQELVLEPGGLSDTYMRPPESVYDRLAKVDGPLAAGTDGAMYNSPYALNLAHPAFGTVATASDLLRFGLLFAPSGTTRIISGAGIRTMTTDQTGGNLSGGPGSFSDGASRPWGIGFMLKGLTSIGGDLLSPQSFGHGGASGCTVWVDPVEDVVVAYVSNSHASKGRPPFTERLVRTVNGVMAAATS